MEQITDSKLLAGKKIKQCVYADNRNFLIFTDDSFCIFKGCGYSDWDCELQGDFFDQQPSLYNIHLLKEIGFIDEIQYGKLLDEFNNNQIEIHREREIQKLRELKAKYPDA